MEHRAAKREVANQAHPPIEPPLLFRHLSDKWIRPGYRANSLRAIMSVYRDAWLKQLVGISGTNE